MNATRMEMSVLGEVAVGAYGSKWQSALAEDLSYETQRKVGATQVHQWASGSRPVPAWVSDAILPVLRRRAYSLQRQANIVHEIADRLRHEIATDLPYEADDEGDRY